jgi:hypothetical protein
MCLRFWTRLQKLEIAGWSAAIPMTSEVFMSDSVESELRQLVQRYRVCWDVLNEYVVRLDHLREQVGFSLELTGTHPEGIEHVEPGCGHCRDVYNGLEQIASWITPKEVRPSFYDIEPFESIIRYEAAHQNRPDVVLKIKILHRAGFGPVDVCEVQCLNEMKEKLKEIGARNGPWPSLKRAG